MCASIKRTIRLKFWGTRGSIATPGPRFGEFGGNTSCLEIACGHQLFIIDAGTGIHPLGQHLLSLGKPIKANLLFTHYHWDHIMGFPFFAPFYGAENEVVIHGEKKDAHGVREVLRGQMVFPYFPVSLSVFSSKLDFRDVKHGDALGFGEVTVKVHDLVHPFGALGYRIECGGSSIGTVFDHEHTVESLPALAAFYRGCDAIVYDASYTTEEYGLNRSGWGHSTPNHGCELARLAGVPRVFLFHHEPTHDDARLREMEDAAKKLHPGAEFARERHAFWF